MDQKAVKAAAQTFRVNPKLDVEKCITELAVGEGLVSFLDEKGTPGIVERALVCPPHSQIGPITPEQRQQIMAGSNVAGVYDKVVDRESAYERLKSKAEQSPAQSSSSGSWFPNLGFPSGGGGGRRGDSLVEAMMKSTARAVGSSVGRQIVRGVLGSLLGGSRK
jgi:DNA helicase HerA-like ATPase